MPFADNLFMKRFNEMPPKDRSLTIRDVAGRARVSVGTVSRVLNGHSDVSPALRRKVEKAIADLGYRPNIRAQSLSRQSSPVLSFILSNRAFIHPFHAQVLQGVSEYCEQAGYFILFAKFEYSGDTPASALRLPRVLQSHGVADCIIVAGTNYGNFLEALEDLGLRYVVLANNLMNREERPAVNQVRFDDVAGAIEAVSYLLQLGHRDIWFFGDTSTPWCHSRYQGYLQAMERAGLEPRGMTVALATDQYLDGYRSAEFILENKSPATAIFCGTDSIAYGAWDALAARGVRVPGDISLIGFDAAATGENRVPQLTSVKVPANAVGRELARMAIERIQTGNDANEVVLPTQLQRRESCRPILRTAYQASS